MYPRAGLVLLTLWLSACDSPAGPGSSQSDCAAAPAPGGAGHAGPLFDTHAHLDQRDLARDIACGMRAQGVDRSVLFVGIDPSDPGGSAREVRQALGADANAFVPFFHVDPKATGDMAPARLEAVTRALPGAVAGIGEVGLYRPPWRGTALAAAPWPDVFEFAAAQGLWLMLHLMPDQAQDLSAMLSAHPATRLLLHGPEFPALLPGLLREHANLYYTLDAASLIQAPGGQGAGAGLMYGASGPADFVARYDRDRDAMLEQAVARWAPVVAAAPERVMWGTDVSYAWHLDPEVYARIVDFSRRFVARLPAEQRAAFAHGNAARLLPPTAPLP